MDSPASNLYEQSMGTEPHYDDPDVSDTDIISEDEEDEGDELSTRHRRIVANQETLQHGSGA
jgi:hypothetical protein